MFHNYKIVNTITRDNTFVLEKNNTLYFGKSNKKSSVPFFNEVAVYKGLEKNSYQYLKYPKLIESDYKSYIVTELIEGEEKRWLPSQSDKENFAKALVEFQLTAKDVNFHFKSKLRALLLSPITSLYRLAITECFKHCGLISFLKVFLLTFRISVRNNKQNDSFLHHRDLLPWAHTDNSEKGQLKIRNMMITEKNEVCFIDFEGTIRSQKFFMNDIIDMAYDFYNDSLDDKWVQYFINEHKTKTIWKNVRMQDQVRVALLRSSMNRLQVKPLVKEYTKFIKEVLLVDSSYDMWFEDKFTRIEF